MAAFLRSLFLATAQQYYVGVDDGQHNMERRLRLYADAYMLLAVSFLLRWARIVVSDDLYIGAISFFGFFGATARATMTGTGATGLGAQSWREGGRDLGGK